ncbi:MAG: RNA polymerase sigma factor [Bacteroidota bacterium]
MESADVDLVVRSQAGDREAFAELVRRYQARLFSFTCRILHDREEALDATQEVFLRAYRALGRYAPSQPFTSWLYTIANNLCIDLIRRRRIRALSLSAPLGEDETYQLEVPDNTNNPELLFASRETQKAIEAAIASLPYKYRLVTVLRHIQGLSYQEISSITGQPEGTVKAQIFRARRILREKLRDVG